MTLICTLLSFSIPRILYVQLEKKLNYIFHNHYEGTFIEYRHTCLNNALYAHQIFACIEVSRLLHQIQALYSATERFIIE